MLFPVFSGHCQDPQNSHSPTYFVLPSLNSLDGGVLAYHRSPPSAIDKPINFIKKKDRPVEENFDRLHYIYRVKTKKTPLHTND